VSAQPLESWANEIVERHGLRCREELRRTTHDLSDRLRNLIWEVDYEGRAAVLKVYEDDVVNVEAESLRAFHDTSGAGYSNEHWPTYSRRSRSTTRWARRNAVIALSFTTG